MLIFQNWLILFYLFPVPAGVCWLYLVLLPCDFVCYLAVCCCLLLLI